MAKNPVEEFLSEKKAFGMGGAMATAKPYAKRVGEGVAMGAMTGLGGAAFAGLTIGAAKLFDAATKTRDFNNMLEANPDLVHHHEQDPVAFNRMFTALRAMAPEFTKEPTVAGTYMRNAMENDPGSRGGIAVQARSDLSHGPRPGPLTEAALGGFGKGVGLNRNVVGQDKATFKPGSDGEVSEVSQTTNRFG